MAITEVQQPAALPSPATITPALLKTHSITPDEYTRIEKALGRTPSLTELGIFSVMWSEHCSYKSSRVHLKRLPTKGTRTSGPGSVVQGPGENAGIIDVGDGWACAFKIESHNHPSYIEPYQGAATGVGGILRDIFTMNARPLAVMDSLRFGPLAPPAPPENCHSERAQRVEGPAVGIATDSIDYARNRQTMSGVVHGVGGYGNCFGVPNLGGETRFEECYSGNPLLNAFALGLVKIDEIFYAKATGVGNPVIYVGAKTGRDGIHGATMASEEFTEGSEQKRPNVQMGDPFLEKLLLEACLEAMATGAVLGIQDMGAAGLTCSTCEMGARGELGLTIELDLVPQRETGMSSYEIMLSESQERMLLVADKGREGEVLRVFEKWGLDASIVGIVTADDTMRVTHHGELVCEIPNKALTDDAPVYHRPVGTWKAPVPLDPPAWVLEELKKPRDYTADLKKLLASANICSKHWIFEQYDSMVQTNTVQGPGGEAGVMRIKGTGNTQATGSVQGAGNTKGTGSATESVILSGAAGEVEGPAVGGSKTPERGLAMALAGNGRWTYLDPKLGAMHAVAEAARKVACTGATPVAATNCLNFGNPEKPEIMAQLSAAIDGIAEACNALGTPITGGNVSLYNETRGEGIYPTPVLGVVGILDDVTKAVPSDFQNAGDAILLVEVHNMQTVSQLHREFGSSEYAKVVLGSLWGNPPSLNWIASDEMINKKLANLAMSGYVKSACDVGSGGVLVAICKSSFRHRIGANIGLKLHPHLSEAAGNEIPEPLAFFYENPAILITCKHEDRDHVTEELSIHLRTRVEYLGSTTKDTIQFRTNSWSSEEISITSLHHSYSSALESQLAAEVLA